MNREQIIQMARDAHGPITDHWFDMDIAALERFAAAIRAATKDEDVQICEDEIASWKRVTNGDCGDEEKALIFVQKAILASK